MSLYTIISNIRSVPPQSEADAAQFLARLTLLQQEQLIAAVYLGREHIHASQLRDDVELSRSYGDQVPQSNYAQVLYEKAGSLDTYLGQLVACARASNFDLNSL